MAAVRSFETRLTIHHRTEEVTTQMGKNKKTASKSLKEKRAEKKAKEADKPSAKTVSKTARASGAKG